MEDGVGEGEEVFLKDVLSILNFETEIRILYLKKFRRIFFQEERRNCRCKDLEAKKLMAGHGAENSLCRPECDMGSRGR